MQIKNYLISYFPYFFLGTASGSSGLGMAEVNQLIQQAFAMGQQSVLQPSGMLIILVVFRN